MRTVYNYANKQVSGYIFVFNLLDELLCILILYFYFYKFYFLTEPRVSAEWFQRPKILWILRRIFKKKQYIFKNVLRTNTASLVTNVVREEVPKLHTISTCSIFAPVLCSLRRALCSLIFSLAPSIPVRYLTPICLGAC